MNFSNKNKEFTELENLTGLRWSSPSVFYFPKASPWLPLFSDTILELRQNGIFAWIEWRWHMKNPEPNESCVSDHGLGYQRTLFLFTILGLGAITSIISAFVEKLASKIALNKEINQLKFDHTK